MILNTFELITSRDIQEGKTRIKINRELLTDDAARFGKTDSIIPLAGYSDLLFDYDMQILYRRAHTGCLKILSKESGRERYKIKDESTGEYYRLTVKEIF